MDSVSTWTKLRLQPQDAAVVAGDSPQDRRAKHPDRVEYLEVEDVAQCLEYVTAHLAIVADVAMGGGISQR